MDSETEKIFREQLAKLPNEVTDFLSTASWSEDLEEIGSMYSLPEDQLYGFKQEATLVLVGLVHPDAFSEMLKQEVHINDAVLEAIVASVEKKIFAPIRVSLIGFFEKEALQNKEDNTIPPEKPRTHMPDVVPENLPTDETGESLLPPIPSKFGKEEAEIPAHPFEEKMKKVFTGGQQSLGDLSIEPPATSATQAPTTPPVYRADPYREPIE